MKKVLTLAFLLIGIIVTGFSQRIKVKVVCIEPITKGGGTEYWNVCLVEDKDQRKERKYVYATIPRLTSLKLMDKGVVDIKGTYLEIRGKSLDLTDIHYSVIKPIKY